MKRYIAKRLFISVITIWALATFSFFLLRTLPGNPFQTQQLLKPEIQEKMMAYYGLDKPLFSQYLTYMGNLLHGDMGYSFKYTNRSVAGIIANTLSLIHI